MTTQPRLILEACDVYELKDTKFMPAEEKRKVLRHWDRFLKANLSKDCFTKALYEHLIYHCQFIAHYSIHGFYETYFEEPEDSIKFLSQFDDRNGIPKSIEYGMIFWCTSPEYHDVNSAMCHIARRYIPALITKLESEQQERDLDRARLLMAKHGVYMLKAK